MINEKYYRDIKNFPEQFAKGFELFGDYKPEGSFKRVLLNGMGGSSSFVELINDMLASVGERFRMEVNRNYTLPNWVDIETFVINSSYSGNTEEISSTMQETLTKNLQQMVITTGGKLLEMAQANNIHVYNIPKGIQPRLSTGYFVSGMLKLLHNMGLIADTALNALLNINLNINEEYCKSLAQRTKNKVPIIYSTAVNSSLARIVKIKFNENCKTQAFFYTFPEVNHNEMEGFNVMVMQPFFVMFKSKFEHPKNIKRIDVFADILGKKNLEVEIVELQGENIIMELLWGHYFADHVTYFLAEEYQVDPEIPAGIEEFKKQLN